MSGRTKKILYTVFGIIAALCAYGGVMLLMYFFCLAEGAPLTATEPAVYASVIAFLAFAVFFPLNLVFHELGHLLIGMCAGLKPISVQIGYLVFTRGKIGVSFSSDANGMTALLARNPQNMRGKYLAAALGGAALNILYGIVFLTLFLCLPTPATLFFGLFAPLQFYEGLLAIVPARLSAGPTDGAVAKGLVKREPFAEVMLAVLKTQSSLVRETYAEIPEKWLFGAPVIQEDDPLFIALTQLRWQYLFFNGDEEGAVKQLERLEDLYEYYPVPDLACDLACLHAVFRSDPDRANDFFADAKKAKGTLSYALAEAACNKEQHGDLNEKIEKERWKGIKEFSRLLAERIKKQ